MMAREIPANMAEEDEAPAPNAANIGEEMKMESVQLVVKDGVVQVPYGSPYSKEQQAKNVQDKVKQGMLDLMTLIRNGTEACVDRATVIEIASQLEQQAEKIGDAVSRDTVYIEEVRHHHNRISDLCDDTRAYTHEQMVADLKRAAAIRVNVMTIVQGKPPEFELEQEELDELKSVRLMLRRRFGAKTRDKDTGGDMDVGPVDQTAMLGDPSAIRADVRVTDTGLFSGNAEVVPEGTLRGIAHTPGSWADSVMRGTEKDGDWKIAATGNR